MQVQLELALALAVLMMLNVSRRESSNAKPCGRRFVTCTTARLMLMTPVKCSTSLQEELSIPKRRRNSTFAECSDMNCKKTNRKCTEETNKKNRARNLLTCQNALNENKCVPDEKLGEFDRRLLSLSLTTPRRFFALNLVS